jgi:serine O-acetyltransferase
MDWRKTLREDLDRMGPGEHMSVITLTLFRLSQGLADPAFGPLRHVLRYPVLLARFLWIDLLMAAQLHPRTEVGPGLRLPHGGRGVCIHPYARVGRNATIFQAVGIGAIEEIDDRGRAKAILLEVPTIGDDVYIGHGANIFGPVTIGDRARIGIGAVVFRDVPADASVLPAPARIMVRKASPDGERDGEADPKVEA